MSRARVLLVVSDQQDLLCRGCESLLGACGVTVRMTANSAEALSLARESDLVGMILEMSGSGRDRARALKVLAQKNPKTPAILLVESSGGGPAVSIASPGIVDCLVEPIGPDDLLIALYGLLCRLDVFPSDAVSKIPATLQVRRVGSDRYHFWNESWWRLADHGLATVGSIPSASHRDGIGSLCLPRVGDVIYQGLPLAIVHCEGLPPQIVPSPLSGLVLSVNPDLEDSVDGLMREPCGRGWIAVVCPTRLSSEAPSCGQRNVVLVSRDPIAASEQSRQMASLGCEVIIVSCWPEAAQVLWDRDHTILVLDAVSLGGEGPEIASRFRSTAPGMRVVVVAASGACCESEYRRQNVFYYALNPFADGEIIDILEGAFRPRSIAAETCE
jgi:CheY-like chemotaxis protein/glycine cleavage system H lipoate-binding protein